MGTITIKNLSTLCDHVAVMRVGMFIAGDKYQATHDNQENRIVRIAKRGNCYTVCDYEV